MLTLNDHAAGLGENFFNHMKQAYGLGRHVASAIDRGYETFKKVYDYATEEKHDFLLVDLAPKPHFPSIFRKGFSEFIVP